MFPLESLNLRNKNGPQFKLQEVNQLYFFLNCIQCKKGTEEICLKQVLLYKDYLLQSFFQLLCRWIQTSCVCQRSLDSRRQYVHKIPTNKKGRWEPRKKFTEMYEYTVEPLPLPRTGGRGPNGLCIQIITLKLLTSDLQLKSSWQKVILKEK